MSLETLRYISLTVSIVCLLFIGILSILYYTKKRVFTKENSVYDVLIFSNVFCLVCEILFYISGYSNNSLKIINFTEKLYLTFNCLWMFLHTIYMLVISENSTRKRFKISYRVKKILTIGIAFFIVFFIFVLPINHNFEEGILISSNGQSMNFMFMVCMILIIINVVVIVMNFKNIEKSKFKPLITFVVLIIIEMLLSMTGFKLLLFTLPMTLVTFIMYHTIENPDMQMIEQLNMAKDQAEKANSAKTDFLSNMSHEIRTPLNAIVGFSNLLLENNQVPKEAKEEVKDIIIASDNLLEIVNGILDISKIEADRLEIVNNEYSTQKLIKELVALTKGRLGDKPIEFKTKFDDAIPAVLYGDNQRLKQIIVNILTNAVKYTKEGSIEFKIDSVLKNDVCRLIISVEDTGIGIKQENIDKLFNRFERLDLEDNITIEGTGLGLAITKKLVDLMGGKIVVQSIFGKGSKFTISIDQRIVVNPTIKIEEEKEEKEEITVVNDKKVLLVDDNKINLKVAERLLENYGIETESVESGFLCIENIQKGKRYDLILLDDMMPKMSGTETLAKLKEIEGFNIPVVVLTANALTGMKEKYLKEGFTDYLAKPIKKDELNRIINEYLNNE